MSIKKNYLFLFVFSLIVYSCTNTQKKDLITIGFLDGVADETLQTAKEGFFKALSDSGFEDGKNIKFIYRNAQGELPVMVQSIDYFKSESVDLIATCPSISTVTAVQRNKDIPVCMMVSPEPHISGLIDASGNPPANLFGVYETQDYIDTAFAMIKTLYPNVSKVGVVFNQSEIQSVSACERIIKVADSLQISLSIASLSGSSDSKITVESLLNKGIEVFFALPDNVVFASFETILNACNSKNVPIFTSEAGLVKRGALSAFGADMYQWGYQAGQNAALFIKKKKTIPSLQPVKKRVKMMNKKMALKYNLIIDHTFTVY